MRLAHLLSLAAVFLACSDNDPDPCKQNPAACRQAEAGVDQSSADLPLSAIDTAVPVDSGQQPYQHEHVTPQTLNGWISAGKAMTLIDVREATEYSSGHIKTAVNLPWNSGVLKQSLAQVPKSLPVVVYCASGSRSNAAATYLVGQGYRPVYDAGGISAWIAAGYPLE